MSPPDLCDDRFPYPISGCCFLKVGQAPQAAERCPQRHAYVTGSGWSWLACTNIPSPPCRLQQASGWDRARDDGGVLTSGVLVSARRKLA
jgi:hypothetical protein